MLVTLHLGGSASVLAPAVPPEETGVETRIDATAEDLQSSGTGFMDDD